MSHISCLRPSDTLLFLPPFYGMLPVLDSSIFLVFSILSLILTRYPFNLHNFPRNKSDNLLVLYQWETNEPDQTFTLFIDPSTKNPNGWIHRIYTILHNSGDH